MFKRYTVLTICIFMVFNLVACGGADEEKDAEEIAKALQSEGLPIEEIKVFTAENDPNELLGRPDQYTSKVNFIDSRAKSDLTDIDDIGIEDGGSIEVFENEEDAKNRFEYVSEITKTPILAEYDYVVRNVLLRLSKKLEPEQAQEYEDKLKEIL